MERRKRWGIQVVLWIYYLQIIRYIFSKRQVSQPPYLYTRVYKISYIVHECTHIMVNSVAPKVIASNVKQYLSNPSLHPINHYILLWATAFSISHFGSTQESFYMQSSAPVVVVLHFRLFYLMHALTELLTLCSNYWFSIPRFTTSCKLQMLGEEEYHVWQLV